MDHPFQPIVGQWVAKIRLALAHKKAKFQDDADECLKFYHGPYDFLYGRKMVPGDPALFAEGALPAPGYRITINKVAELVQLFGPALYHRNPTRKVTPRQTVPVPPELWQFLGDPRIAAMQAQQYTYQATQRAALDRARAFLLEAYLNATPASLDLKTESRNAIDEALIKGMGLLTHDVYEPPGSGKRMAGSFFQTVDDLVIDPDMESLREAKWIALRCRHPHWQVEDEYGLTRDSLKKAAGTETVARQAEANATGPDGRAARRRGESNDLVTYWKVYSKMGLGGRLAGVGPRDRDLSDIFGQFCYLVLAEGVPFPLNVPPGTMQQATDPEAGLAVEQEVRRRTSWPTPFWADDSWPISALAFHWVPREVYPMSHLRPAMGELKAINWIWSMLVAKVKTASRDFIAVAKSSSEELKSKISHGSDYTVVEFEALHESIDNVVKFLQHPAFNPEIYKVLQGLTELFDRRTGLTELLYGLSASQLRSAEEAALKGDQVSVRPDEMASKVEDWQGAVAAHEAFCARYHLLGQDVVPQLGEEAAYWWDQLLSAADPDLVLQMQYRIESGSTRKPNRNRDIANAQQAMSVLFAPLLQYGQLTGDIGPVNALLTQWGKANDLDTAPLLLAPPPPPPTVPAPTTSTPPTNGRLMPAV